MTRGSAGGQARAIIQKAEARVRMETYLADPNHCKNCDVIIPLNDYETTSQTRKRKFCNLRCAAKFNSVNTPNKLYRNKGSVKLGPKNMMHLTCAYCLNPFDAEWERKFCSPACKIVGRVTPALRERQRLNRQEQIKEEEVQANKLRAEGWEVLYTSNCCDRIAIKDGKVYFIEFKRKGSEELATGQKRLSEVAGDQFKVIVYNDFVLRGSSNSGLRVS